MSKDLGLGHPGRREAAVAVAVACVLILVSWIASKAGDEPQADGRSSLASNPGESVVSLDVSRKVSPGEIEACLTDSFAKNPKRVDVLYEQIQKSEQGDVAVLILRNRAGDLRLCDSFGGDAPSVAPIAYADDVDPVRFLSNGRQSWKCDGTRLAGFAISHWLSVGDAVDRVDLRFVVDGATGRWFSSEADNGFAHVHGWLPAQNDGAMVQVQTRVLDADGAAVEQNALPTAPRGIAGCTGGDIDLG